MTETIRDYLKITSGFLCLIFGLLLEGLAECFTRMGAVTRSAASNVKDFGMQIWEETE